MKKFLKWLKIILLVVVVVVLAILTYGAGSALVAGLQAGSWTAMSSAWASATVLGLSMSAYTTVLTLAAVALGAAVAYEAYLTRSQAATLQDADARVSIEAEDPGLTLAWDETDATQQATGETEAAADTNSDPQALAYQSASASSPRSRGSTATVGLLLLTGCAAMLIATYSDVI